jgi:hypothetical protein
MRTPPEPVKVETLAQLGERFLTSRYDLDERTKKMHRSALQRINAWAGERDWQTLIVADCLEFVGILAPAIAPSTLRKYWNTLAQELDFAGLEPNPARDKRVKLPTLE